MDIGQRWGSREWSYPPSSAMLCLCGSSQRTHRKVANEPSPPHCSLPDCGTLAEPWELSCTLVQTPSRLHNLILVSPPPEPATRESGPPIRETTIHVVPLPPDHALGGAAPLPSPPSWTFLCPLLQPSGHEKQGGPSSAPSHAAAMGKIPAL